MAIRLEECDRHCVLTIERPKKHNSLDESHVSQLIEALDQIARSGSRALVITGVGTEAFCAGADLRLMAEASDDVLRRFLVNTRKVFRGLSELAIPTIAAVNGHAHGAGAEIACICDLRVGCERATFRFPGLAYGMAVGTWHLPSVVGLAKAKELLLTTDPVDAEQAHAIGLLNRLVPASVLLDQSNRLAEQIAQHPPEAVRAVKSLLNRTVGAPLQQRFYRELYSNNERSREGTVDTRALFRAALAENE